MKELDKILKLEEEKKEATKNLFFYENISKDNTQLILSIVISLSALFSTFFISYFFQSKTIMILLNLFFIGFFVLFTLKIMESIIAFIYFSFKKHFKSVSLDSFSIISSLLSLWIIIPLPVISLFYETYLFLQIFYLINIIVSLIYFVFNHKINVLYSWKKEKRKN